MKKIAGSSDLRALGDALEIVAVDVNQTPGPN